MSKIEQIKSDFVEAMTNAGKEGTTPYDTEASVVRVDGSTAWVHIPGGVTETPVAMTINCVAGDKVQVRVSGGSAWLTGNASAPPTDDRVAKVAQNTADTASANATEAKETAEQAQAAAGAVVGIAQQAIQIAGDTAQHFWFTSTGADTGAHITEVTQDEWEQDPTAGGGNLLARTNGIALRNGLIELATLQQSGMDINTFDSQGNLISIAHLGYGSGTDSGGGTSDAPYYTFGTRAAGSVGNYSTAQGWLNEASGYCSHAEGVATQAKEVYCHTEGQQTKATDRAAHAEGHTSEATGFASHAEGGSTTASGDYSHAEGGSCIAAGTAAHAAGFNTQAGSKYQTAIGKMNIRDDADTYAVIVGNGDLQNLTPSNALALAWDGETELALDTTAASGTDYDLYTAITSLGWASDVIA